MIYCPYAKAAYIQGLIVKGEGIHNIGAIHFSDAKIGEYPAKGVLECMKEACGMYKRCTSAPGS